jgi:hypothetical protein
MKAPPALECAVSAASNGWGIIKPDIPNLQSAQTESRNLRSGFKWPDLIRDFDQWANQTASAAALRMRTFRRRRRTGNRCVQVQIGPPHQGRCRRYGRRRSPVLLDVHFYDIQLKIIGQ